ncbi:hypothetical protein FKB34_02155 [Glycocaulis profundi]|nr:hypothetical protein FKB34_02155 [Glycocaulis profundi]
MADEDGARSRFGGMTGLVFAVVAFVFCLCLFMAATGGPGRSMGLFIADPSDIPVAIDAAQAAEPAR